MESDASDKDIALDDAAEGAYYHEEQEGVMQTSSTKAPHLPTLFESLGHSNVILIGGAGSSSHKPGAIGEKAWKAGQHGKKALKLPVCIASTCEFAWQSPLATPPNPAAEEKRKQKIPLRRQGLHKLQLC